MAAGQQPAVEPAVVDDQDAFAVGGEHQAGAGDVAGSKLVAGKGVGGAIEQQRISSRLLRAWPSEGSWKWRARAGTAVGVDHKNEKASAVDREAFKLIRATSYSPTHSRVQYHRG